MLLSGIMIQSYIFLNFLEAPIYPKISMPPNLFCQPATMVPCLRYLTALQTCSHCMNTQSLNYHIQDKFIKEIKEAKDGLHTGTIKWNKRPIPQSQSGRASPKVSPNKRRHLFDSRVVQMKENKSFLMSHANS